MNLGKEKKKSLLKDFIISITSALNYGLQIQQWQPLQT